LQAPHWVSLEDITQYDVLPNEVWEAMMDAIDAKCKVEDAERRTAAKAWQAKLTPRSRERHCVVPMTPLVHEALLEQKKAFIEKFGREPGSDDPVFFDPDKMYPRQSVGTRRGSGEGDPRCRLRCSKGGRHPKAAAIETSAAAG